MVVRENLEEFGRMVEVVDLIDGEKSPSDRGEEGGVLEFSSDRREGAVQVEDIRKASAEPGFADSADAVNPDDGSSGKESPDSGNPEGAFDNLYHFLIPFYIWCDYLSIRLYIQSFK